MSCNSLHDPLYPGGRFWNSSAGVIILLTAIECICMPILYIGASFKKDAIYCIGCQSEAMELGSKIELIASIIMIINTLAMIGYVLYLFYKSGGDKLEKVDN